MIIVGLIALLTGLFYLKYEKIFFLLIPVFSILTSFVYPLITDVNSSIQPETNTATILLKLFVTIVPLLICLKIIINTRHSKFSAITLFFLVYILLISLFSNDISTSLTRLIIIGSNMLMLPAALIVFSKADRRVLFFKILVATNVLAIVYIVYSSLFQVGFAVYGNETLRYGGLLFFGLYLFVFSIPIFLLNLTKKFDLILLLIVIIQIAILVLSLKRTYLLFLGLFLLSFTITMFRQKKTRLSGFLIITVFLSIAIYNSDVILNTQSTRGKELTRETIESEGRYLEYLIYFDERIANTSLITFTGSNPFSNRGDFGKDNKYGLNTVDRTLHSDYVTFLYGVGLIGIIILIVFYVSILSYLRKINKLLIKSNLDKSHILLALTFVIALLLSQAIDGLYIYWARGIPFTLLGYLIAQDIAAINLKND